MTWSFRCARGAWLPPSASLRATDGQARGASTQTLLPRPSAASYASRQTICRFTCSGDFSELCCCASYWFLAQKKCRAAASCGRLISIVQDSDSMQLRYRKYGFDHDNNWRIASWLILIMVDFDNLWLTIVRSTFLLHQNVLRRFDFNLIRRRVELGIYQWNLNKVSPTLQSQIEFNFYM